MEQIIRDILSNLILIGIGAVVLLIILSAFGTLAIVGWAVFSTGREGRDNIARQNAMAAQDRAERREQVSQ